MPQMSPMNWILIVVSFFLFMNMIKMSFSNMMTPMKMKKIQTKKIYWKW